MSSASDGPGRPPQSSSSSTTRAMAAARSARRRRPSSSVRPDEATPTRLPMTNRRFTTALVSATFWWIWLLAKRVRAASSAMTNASASVAPSRSAWASAASARRSASSARSSIIGRPPGRSAGPRLPLAHSDLHVPEAGARDRVADVGALAGLALAAVGRAEHHVARLVADRVARAPELVGDARVGRVLEQPALLAALDLVGDLGGELEVEPAVVDGP